MSDFEKEFKELTALAEEQKNKKMRLKGSLDTVTSELKKKGLSSPTQVVNFLAKKRAELDVLRKKKTSLLEEFRKKYAKFI